MQKPTAHAQNKYFLIIYSITLIFIYFLILFSFSSAFHILFMQTKYIHIFLNTLESCFFSCFFRQPSKRLIQLYCSISSYRAGLLDRLVRCCLVPDSLYIHFFFIIFYYILCTLICLHFLSFSLTTPKLRQAGF